MLFLTSIKTDWMPEKKKRKLSTLVEFRNRQLRLTSFRTTGFLDFVHRPVF
jgi:hypothetical protein